MNSRQFLKKILSELMKTRLTTNTEGMKILINDNTFMLKITDYKPKITKMKMKSYNPRLTKILQCTLKSPPKVQ
jgi:hypothetical protein